MDGPGVLSVVGLLSKVVGLVPVVEVLVPDGGGLVTEVDPVGEESGVFAMSV